MRVLSTRGCFVWPSATAAHSRDFCWLNSRKVLLTFLLLTCAPRPCQPVAPFPLRPSSTLHPDERQITRSLAGPSERQLGAWASMGGPLPEVWGDGFWVHSGYLRVSKMDITHTHAIQRNHCPPPKFTMTSWKTWPVGS